MQAEHTIFDSPATIGALVCTLAEETQTMWFLFLGKHTGQIKGALLEEWMEIERKAASKW